MAFTLTFNSPVSITTPVSDCNWTSTDGGITYTTSDTPGMLHHFFEQPWKDNLVSVTGTPNSVTYLDGYVFFQCANLTTVEIPSSVTTIYQQSFYSCPELTSVIFLDNSSLTVIDFQTFSYCVKLSNFIIPSSVTTIRNNAFQNCTSLTSITIPNGMTSLPNYCFYNCTSLLSITIPSTVTTFDNNEIFFNIPSNATPNSSNAATLYTSPLDESNPVYNYFFNTANFQNTINYSILYLQSPPCFKEGTLILTYNGYIPVQDLRKGDLVKTLTNDYVPINIIGKKSIDNKLTDLQVHRLFVCSNENYPEIFQDLYITGLHSILVDNIREEQHKIITELYSLDSNDIFITEGKIRMPVFLDKKARPYEIEGNVTIYHLALDNENEEYNYGIYANGLLVETTSIKLLKESDMIVIE
jgi:hypothetical protein